MHAIWELQPDLIAKTGAARLKNNSFDAADGAQAPKPLMQSLRGLRGIKGWEGAWIVHGLVRVPANKLQRVL